MSNFKLILMIMMMNFPSIFSVDFCTNDVNSELNCSNNNYVDNSINANLHLEIIDKDNNNISLTHGERFAYSTAAALSTPHQNSFVINELKHFLREKSTNKLRQQSILDFYALLESHSEVQNLYSALSIVEDFESLEQQIFSLKKSIDFYPFYQSLLTRISQYAKTPKPAENSAQYKKLYGFLYTATLSKMYVLRNNSEPNLITDITLYLDLVSTQFKDLNQLQTEFNKVASINQHNVNYKKRLENKINEANQFIKQDITPEIDKVNHELDQQIEQLVQETKDKLAQAEDEREEAVERKNKLAKAMVFRGIFSVVKVCSQMFSFLGPVGTGVGAVVGGVSTVTESFVLDSNVGTNQMTTLPLGVRTDLGSIGAQMKSAKDQKIANFKLKLDEITKEMDTIGKETIGAVDDIDNIRTRFDSLRKQSEYDAADLGVLEEELKSSLKKKEAELKATITVKDEKFVRTMKTMDKVNMIATFTTTSVDIYNKFKNDKEKLDAASAAVKVAEENVKKLAKYEEDIYKVIAPMVKNMEKGLDEVAEKLKNNSPVALEVSKWRVQSTLRDAKLTLRKFTKDFQVEDYLARSIEKLEEAMTTLINVYDRIENYEEQKHLADYLNDINSAGAKAIQLAGDPALDAAVKKLEIAINSNMVINDYDVALSALKQWLFPFAHLYLEEFQLPEHLVPSDGYNLQNVIANAGKQIQDIQRKIQKYKSGTFDRDTNIFKTEFDSDYASSAPFFVWSNERFREEIHGLLSGSEISLKADVESSDKDKDAIKFNLVKFRLKINNNQSAQGDLDLQLKNLSIRASHMGNSYYRFKDEMYVFNSESQSLEYTFEKQTNGEPVKENEVYRKIKAGNLMLSPYAMWTLKLVEPSRGTFSFAELVKFKDQVSIEMVGSGSYVKQNAHDYYFDDYNQFVY